MKRAQKWRVLNLYCGGSSGQVGAGALGAASSLTSTLSAAAAGVMATWSRTARNRARSWPVPIAPARVRGVLDGTVKRNQINKLDK